VAATAEAVTARAGARGVHPSPKQALPERLTALDQQRFRDGGAERWEWHSGAFGYSSTF